mmetsp:Transcript_37521/g.43800  ORF Transcript_37521/g.43800 Transcript_37521/m.43800 type:complete len:334 (-) Transcript_37521:75-1076(-)|eukprot:CAMPEP_0176428080 /NCGR_PEP_ID=MMETSP0127-20121128/12948_1 /TAXON_ID=938130 /ORGANISM="Platyophrya macrostoma, Strain WH" /LENGTH=333 /DNA_ID=CAMNT_0017809717 /DNA_START=39 /DNA_END=1040 /DNA_ORIENTATION=-
MSYFVNRGDDAPRRGKAIISMPVQEEKGSGRRRLPMDGDVLPSMVGRGDTRDEVLDRKVAQYHQQQSLLPVNRIDDPTMPPQMLQKRPLRPPCSDNDSSAVHLFGPARMEAAPVVRLRPNNSDDDKLRAIWAPPDPKKDNTAERFAQQPTMVERMMAQKFPLPHPTEKNAGGRSARGDRNHSQLTLGGFVAGGGGGQLSSSSIPDDHALIDGSPQRQGRGGQRRRVDVDYAAYVPDRIQHKPFYAIDGKMVAASEGAEHMKNFFTGEPLLCGRFMAEPQQSANPPPPSFPHQSSAHAGGAAAAYPLPQESVAYGDVPEPPPRRSFEYGHRVLQ